MTRFPATVFAAALLAAASQPALAETLKLGTLAPEGSPWHEVIRDIAEDWKAETMSRRHETLSVMARRCSI